MVYVASNEEYIVEMKCFDAVMISIEMLHKLFGDKYLKLSSCIIAYQSALKLQLGLFEQSLIYHLDNDIMYGPWRAALHQFAPTHLTLDAEIRIANQSCIQISVILW